MSDSYGCISCLKTDKVFNIFDTHECEGMEEVYADMLKICFDITISVNPLLNYMCENCILNLRQAYYFKQLIVANLKALKTALASQIKDETPNDFESKIQLEEGLDPATGIMTLIVTKQNEDDEQLLEYNEFEIIGDIKVNDEDSNEHSIKEDLVNSSTVDEDNKEEMKKALVKVKNEKQLAESTHFECGDCGKKFPTKVAIARHVHTHVPGTFACPICGKEFSKRNSRNSHQWRVHSTPEPYACSHCGVRFPTFHQRLRHLEVEHGRKEEYPCPHCDKVYSYAGARSMHIRETHMRVHRYNCSECRMGFFKRRGLLNHLASIHGIGEKKHVCPICDKSFFRFTVLRNHMKLHSEKPEMDSKNVCHICHARFKYKTVLRNHMKCHELDSLGRSTYSTDHQNVPVE